MTRQAWRWLAPLAFISSGAAQAADEDEQLWLQANASVKLSDHWQLSEEVIARFSDARNGLYETENNLLIGYKLSKAVGVWAGYTHDPQYSAGRFTIMERRAREQLTFDNIGKVAGGSVSLRMRAEQRWRDGQPGTGWRVRPYVKYSLPLSRGGTQLILWHESFINLNAVSFQTQAGYDRMRNNLLVRVPLAKRLSGEIGYLNQYGFLRGGTDRVDHAATFSIAVSL